MGRMRKRLLSTETRVIYEGRLKMADKDATPEVDATEQEVGQGYKDDSEEVSDVRIVEDATEDYVSEREKAIDAIAAKRDEEFSQENEEVISSVCKQCFILQEYNGYSPLIVSSGAVAAALYPKFSSGLRATIGEPKKVNIFQKIFEKFGIISGQILLTDENLRFSDVIMERLWESFYWKVVQIFNANDGVWNKELKMLQKSADNDELLCNICLFLYEQIFLPILPIIAIKEKGLLDFQGNVVPVVDKNNFSQALSYANGGNSLGYGSKGMRTKLLVCRELLDKGMDPMIVSANEPNFILRVVKGEENFGTTFI